MSDLANELRALCADECRNRIDYRCAVCRGADAVERLAAAEASKEDAIADARAQFAKYMDCHKAYRAIERERDEELAAVKKAGIVFQRMGTDLVAINMPLNDATARLAAAVEARDEYKRLWKDACRVKDVRRVAAKGGRDER